MLIWAKTNSDPWKPGEAVKSKVTHWGHGVPGAATAGRCCSSPECTGEGLEDHHWGGKKWFIVKITIITLTFWEKCYFNTIQTVAHYLQLLTVVVRALLAVQGCMGWGCRDPLDQQDLAHLAPGPQDTGDPRTRHNHTSNKCTKNDEKHQIFT